VIARSLAHARPECFWLDQPDRPDPTPALVDDGDADLAIVGGGFTGLWAALLALERDPGRRVVVLEGERIGDGASGRNGGFADPSICHGLMNGLHHFADEIDILHELGKRNFAELLETLERHAIDARYEATGKIEVATAPSEVADIQEHFDALVRLGERPQWLDCDAMRREVASPTYLAGLVESGGGNVDPARLCWGLAAAVRALGGEIYEGTPIVDVRLEGSSIELRARAARMRARSAILATNAYRSPLRRVRRATIPVWDYVLVSEPLSAAQRQAIGWQNRQGIGDNANQFHYYRLTADDRILWGGYDAVYYFGGDHRARRRQNPAVFETLARHFFETFPQLDDLHFTHCWGGPIATTTRFCLDAGSAMRGRLAWAGGYTGLGVGASRFGARVALDLIDDPGAPHLDLRIVRRRPFPWPPEPLRYLVVQLTRHALARADRNDGRRGAWLRLLDRLGLGFAS